MKGLLGGGRDRTKNWSKQSNRSEVQPREPEHEHGHKEEVRTIVDVDSVIHVYNTSGDFFETVMLLFVRGKRR